ncbi:MAG TPA: hypothetical protein VIO61_06670 [Anaerolineaceae bacterium]
MIFFQDLPGVIDLSGRMKAEVQAPIGITGRISWQELELPLAKRSLLEVSTDSETKQAGCCARLVRMHCFSGQEEAG